MKIYAAASTMLYSTWIERLSTQKGGVRSIMKKPDKLKIAIIGAGSGTFCPITIQDILLNDRINGVPLEVCLMDIAEKPLMERASFAREVAQALGRAPRITVTTQLEQAVDGSDFVVTAIELRRYHYWSQDFHIPRKYGFRQIYGENGGPGGMFHALRNLGPMLTIARAMERLCPDAWLINYTNPEAKLVEGIAKLTKIKVVGLCHGIGMGIRQLAKMFEVPEEELDVTACGMNHFSWFQSIRSRTTGRDLYPELRDREKRMQWLADWDDFALSRIMFRTYGLWPLPGANHIGEYVAWSDSYLASSQLQYFYDPAEEHPWTTGRTPDFVYSLKHNPTAQPFYVQQEEPTEQPAVEPGQLRPSHEVGIPLIEAIAFDIETEFGSVNVPNHGNIPGIPDDMVVELPACADGSGIHARQMQELPTAVTEMIRVQGAIHKLVIEAYAEQSRRKLLQALLLDPTISSYNNAVALINEMCEWQKEVLPPLHW